MGPCKDLFSFLGKLRYYKYFEVRDKIASFWICCVIRGEFLKDGSKISDLANGEG